MRKPASFYFFKRKPIVLKDRYKRWRGVADLLGFRTQERLRVEWIVFYYTAGKENVTLTAQHFGMPGDIVVDSISDYLMSGLNRLKE